MVLEALARGNVQNEIELEVLDGER